MDIAPERRTCNERLCCTLDKEAWRFDSWEVISGIISRVTIVITHIEGLLTPLITTHEPRRGTHGNKEGTHGTHQGQRAS